MLLMTAMALMTGAAVLAVLWPLARRTVSEPSERRADVAFYEDQLREIDRDLDRSLITPDEADSARAEAGRRLLRARTVGGRTISATGEPALRRRRAASAFALSAIPLISLAVYGVLGSPHLRSEAAGERLSAAGVGDFASALARIEAHLAADPQDGRGWDVVAPVYLRTGRFADAVNAFSAALRIGGDDANRLTGLGEALVARSGGTVSAEAVEVLERALALDPSSIRARFYLAIGAEQDGKDGTARAEYAKIVATSPPDAPWLAAVQERLARLGTSPAAVASGTTSTPATPEIHAMVDGLDARLRAGGGTEAEWARLVRSYVVLGRRDDAQERLARARTALVSDGTAGARLDSLAHDLGLTERQASR